jgi:hypothetical protein
MSIDLRLEILSRAEGDPVMAKASGLAADEVIGGSDQVLEGQHCS